MKIAIEAQRIFRPNKHGMDFVALESIKELQKLDKVNEYFIFVQPGPDKTLKNTENFHIIELSCPSYPLWEQVALPHAVKKVKADILHCTSNTAPVFCNVPLVLTLHDIIFLEKQKGKSKSLYQNMGRIYRRLVVPKILEKCKKIITVSRFEASRISDALNIKDGRIVAVYNGYSSHFKVYERIADVTSRYTKCEKYIFFLGNTDPKKNTRNTLKAYSLYLERSEHKLPLLIADLKEPYIDEVLNELNIQHIKEYLHNPGYIPNGDLPFIYNGAFAFLYTSLRESFGIPILESMACGTPIITSNTSAMPEIAGEGAILTDPTNPEMICSELLRLEDDSQYYKSKVAYGLERVNNFSWKSTAEELLKLYKELGNE